MTVPKITTFNILLILFGMVIIHQVVLAIVLKSDMEVLAGNLGISTVIGAVFLFGFYNHYKKEETEDIQ
jgi:hypothetical protein